MSQVVDTVFTGSELDRSLVKPHADIDADVLKAIVANQNYLWSRKGVRTGGMIFSPSPYTGTTSTTTYAQTSSTGDYSLKNWMGVCTPQRREAGTVPTYGFTLIIMGRNIDVRATCIRFNNGSTTQIGQFEATSVGANYLWATADIEFSEAACHMSGSTANALATLGFYLETTADQAVGTYGASELLQFTIIESIGVAADLPDS